MCLLLASMTFSSCQTEEPQTKDNLVGYYETSFGSLFNRLQWLIVDRKYKFNASYKLSLDSNNTFSLKGCKCEAKGDWFVKNDSLIVVNKQLNTGEFPGSCMEEFTFKYVVWEDGSLFQVFPDYQMVTYLRKINNKAQSSNKQSRL